MTKSRTHSDRTMELITKADQWRAINKTRILVEKLAVVLLPSEFGQGKISDLQGQINKNSERHIAHDNFRDSVRKYAYMILGAWFILNGIFTLVLIVLK